MLNIERILDLLMIVNHNNMKKCIHLSCLFAMNINISESMDDKPAPRYN